MSRSKANLNKFRSEFIKNSGFGNSSAVFGTEQEMNIRPEIIRMARKSGHLNLANNGLSKVPDKVFYINELDEKELKNVKVDLSMDKQSDEKWWEQVDLSRLYLNSNALTEIDPLISKLQMLQILDISDNSLKNLPDSIGELKCLSKLILSHNKIEKLPNEISKLDELKHLAINQNNLSCLPENIGSMYSLEFLDVSHNNLTSLPAEVGHLQRVTKLLAFHNKLNYLPLEIGDMFNLSHLDVSKNELTILPKSLGKLPKIQELYIRQNKLCKFPCLNCESLREIYLAQNRIKTLEEKDLKGITGLNVLDLSENCLENIPDEITILQNLYRLDLVNNCLSSLPAHIGLLQHLKVITLEGNPLKLVRRDIVQRGTQELLKYLAGKATQPLNTYPGFESCSNCLPKEEINVPDKFEMKSSKSLIYNQKAACIPPRAFENASFAKVRTADLSNNVLTEFPDGLEQLSDHLYDLILNRNRLKSLPSCIVSFKNLQFLDLQNNQISELPEEISQLNSLREINISFNRFTVFPTCVCDVASLEILFAGDNKIADIPVSNLKSLTRLATLDLHNNDISFVPPVMGTMTQLRNVQLEGNRFRVPRADILAKGTNHLLEYLRSRIVPEK